MTIMTGTLASSRSSIARSGTLGTTVTSNSGRP
jgi:hypothetical protein